MNENLIERYLLDLLSPEEKKSFEEQLKNNDTLTQEVKAQRDIIKDIEGIGRIELKSKLKKIHKELYPDQQKSNSKYRKLFFRIAIAAVFFGVLSFGWWCLQQTLDAKTLFSQHYEPYELSLAQRSEVDVVFSQIENLYFNGEYGEAIPLFKDVLNNGNDRSSQLLMGLGIAYLETDQPQKAITQFSKIITTKDFNFEDEAEWYLGLTFLKLNEIEKAKEHLNVLASDDTKDNHLAARAIIAQLKNN